ncbi:MAG: hypothetical protein ACJASR_002244 [Psychroserpens sp.]|jgi:hypothetical protein
MTKYEEIYFISTILSKANADKSVDLNESNNWESLFLTDDTKVHEDYLHELNNKGILDYEEIGEEGFKPIIMCSLKPETTGYLKNLITNIETESSIDKKEIVLLNKRITEILTFDPKRLSDKLNETKITIANTKEQLKSNPLLQPLALQLEQIEIHFKSLSKVANNYEEVYKNIILPVKEEGSSGVRQTVKWAIISIIISTLLSVIISWLTR